MLLYPYVYIQKPTATTTTTETSSATTESSLGNFREIFGGDDTDGTPGAAVEGFHLKLEEDIAVGSEATANLTSFAFSQDKEGLFSRKNTGFDIIDGIFRPSNGFYLLSCRAQVAVKPLEGQTTTSSGEPRVTVTICINGNCGNSA